MMDLEEILEAEFCGAVNEIQNAGANNYTHSQDSVAHIVNEFHE